MASLERFLIERRKTKSNHNGRCDQKRGNYLQKLEVLHLTGLEIARGANFLNRSLWERSKGIDAQLKIVLF